jgi:hypothetical protein
VNVPDRLKRAPRAFVIVCCAGAIFLPPMIGNFGLGLKSGGPLGVMPYSDGLALQRTFVGEVAAVDKICAGIPQGSSVLIVDAKMMLEFGQAIRGTCNVPVAGAQTTITDGVQPDIGSDILPGTIVSAVRAIEDSGHHPLVLAATQSEFAPLIQQFGDGTVKLLLDQQTNDDEHSYFGTPRNTVSETFAAYSWEPTK